MRRITKIKPFNLAGVFMIISFVIGLFISIITSYKVLALGSTALGNFILVVVTITFGYMVIGFLLGLLVAITYNATIKLHGGIKLETEPVN
jgi:hypothetical protein